MYEEEGPVPTSDAAAGGADSAPSDHDAPAAESVNENLLQMPRTVNHGVVDRYIAAWNEPGPDARRRLPAALEYIRRDRAGEPRIQER